MPWYERYLNIPFKHLGDDINTGIDCVNLSAYIFKQELDIDIKIKSYDHCNIVDEHWYSKMTIDPFYKELINNENWVKVNNPSKYDIILLSLGSTNVTNHCGMYLGDKKILHTSPDKRSWAGIYGNYYKQYTVGIYRWKSLIN